MTVLLIFIAVIVGLNCIPLLTKINSPKLEKVIFRILIFSTIIFVFITIFIFYDYRLKGSYSNSIIGLTFLMSCFLFFIIVKNSWKKIIIIVLLIPLILISIYTLQFGQALYECRINNTYKIETFIGGFLACGENIRITKSEFGIFDKSIYSGSSLCLSGIDKIETIEFNQNHVELLIYHDGKFDSENPYKYEFKNKNVW